MLQSLEHWKTKIQRLFISPKILLSTPYITPGYFKSRNKSKFSNSVAIIYRERESRDRDRERDSEINSIA
jgi:hypothetical protein